VERAGTGYGVTIVSLNEKHDHCHGATMVLYPTRGINAMTTDGMPERIQNAIQLAFRKHRGQHRKGTEFPYIVHPLL
jgi:hypothetical protein